LQSGAHLQCRQVRYTTSHPEADDNEVLQEVHSLKAKVLKVTGEGVHLKHLLSLEQEHHERTKQDLEAVRTENKDLIVQKSHLAATAASADEVKSQLDKLQVWPLNLRAALKASMPQHRVPVNAGGAQRSGGRFAGPYTGHGTPCG
jgi:flagellar biosynthesis/type III secretory pathway ATPase